MRSNLIYSLYIPMRYYIIMHTFIEFLIIRIFFSLSLNRKCSLAVDTYISISYQKPTVY